MMEIKSGYDTTRGLNVNLGWRRIILDIGSDIHVNLLNSMQPNKSNFNK